MKKNIKVIKSEPPESTAIMAKSIIAISDGFKKLTEEGLTTDAIAILLAARVKVRITDVRLILESLPKLKGWYVRGQK